MAIDSCKPEDTVSLVVAGILVFGTWLSYFPQQVEIVWKRSSEGLSAFFMFMMTLANFTNTLATVILQYELFVCCTSVNFWTCNEVLLPEVWVVGMNFINVYPIYILFLIYFDATLYNNPNEKRISWALFMFFNFLFFALGGIAVCLHLWADSSVFKDYGKAVGVISSISNVVMWLPQIWHTYKLKHAGSLSIPMLALQAPGALIVFLFEIIGGGANWAVALPFFAAFVMVTFLLAMAIYFEVKNRWFKKPADPEPEDDYLIPQNESVNQ